MDFDHPIQRWPDDSLRRLHSQMLVPAPLLPTSLRLTSDLPAPSGQVTTDLLTTTRSAIASFLPAP